jgi:hypothetical protein
MQADVMEVKYKSFTQTYMTLYAEGGIPRFYRGTGWRAVNLVGSLFFYMQAERFFRALIG